MNVDNGFILSFKLRVTKKFEGFAVVLSKSDYTMTGQDGSGLGYAGKENTVAIEFDNKYSGDKHDPKDSTTHLSVIISKDNQADE